MFKDYNKPTVLITGASRGLGLELTKQLLLKNRNVIATARNPETIIEKIEGNYRDSLFIAPLDVSVSESIQNLVVQLTESGIQLDVLLNNAALGVGKSTVSAPDMTEVRDIFDVNFFGLWQLTGAMIPFFRNSGERCIINISSQMGALDDMKGDHAAYRLSKAALNALSLSLSSEISRTGIKVHTVCPGWIKTDMGGIYAPGDVETAAANIIYLAETPALPSGRFWKNRKPVSW